MALAQARSGVGHVESPPAGHAARDERVRPTATAIETSRRNKGLRATSVTGARLVPSGPADQTEAWQLVSGRLDRRPWNSARAGELFRGDGNFPRFLPLLDDQTLAPRSRSAFPITDTELKLIAAAAMMGLKSHPNAGYRTPAAIGTPAAL